MTPSRPNKFLAELPTAIRITWRGIATAALLFSASAISAGVSGPDEISLSSQRGQPGMTAMIPVRVVDNAGTALGEDQVPTRQIQGLSLGVMPSSTEHLTSLGFVAAGLLDGPTPLFETSVQANGTVSWIIAFDGANHPLSFTLNAGDLVGWLAVGVSAAAPLGTVIDFNLVPQLCSLSNQGGSVVQFGANGNLTLTGGSLLVDSVPLFEDGFESGDLNAWSSSSP